MKIDGLMRHYGKKHNTLLKFQTLVNMQTGAFLCVCAFRTACWETYALVHINLYGTLKASSE